METSETSSEHSEDSPYNVTRDLDEMQFTSDESEGDMGIETEGRSEHEGIVLSDVEGEALTLSKLYSSFIEHINELEDETIDEKHEVDIEHFMDYKDYTIQDPGERTQDTQSTSAHHHSSKMAVKPSQLTRTSSLNSTKALSHTSAQTPTALSFKSSEETANSSVKSISVKHDEHPSVNILKKDFPETKTAVKAKMKRWFNRDNRQPAEESFLGSFHSGRYFGPGIRDPNPSSTLSHQHSFETPTQPCQKPRAISLTSLKTAACKIGRPEPKLCMEKRMRNWLNRDFKHPAEEGFLGKAQSEDGEPPVDAVGDLKERRKLCACAISVDHNFPKVVASDEAVLRRNDRNFCHCKDGDRSDGRSQAVDHSTRFKENDLPKKLKVCSCCPSELHERDTNDDHFRVQQHHKKKKWTRQMRKSCHCRKSGWMSSGRWPKNRRAKCICKSHNEERKQFLAEMKLIRSAAKDIEIQKVINQRREEKIEELYKVIGPTLAAEYRALAEKHPKTTRRKEGDYEKSVLAEFGDQLRRFKQQHLKSGKIFRDYDRNDNNSFHYLEFPNGSCYYGQISQLGSEGKCIYKMAHGPVFVGTMLDGKMEGPGRLIYPNGGTVDGVWVNGTLFEPIYTFGDGLKFQPNQWNYCRMPDRRFVSEIVNGMNSPDNTQLCSSHPARQIPNGCLDAEEGFYDPMKKVILHPCSGKIMRIVGEQEAEWITRTCRREWFEEVPFSRRMHENWYAGTVFPQPKDEADWFENEFPKVILPYENVDDVIQARRMAMIAGHGVSPEKSFMPDKQKVVPKRIVPNFPLDS